VLHKCFYDDPELPIVHWDGLFAVLSIGQRICPFEQLVSLQYIGRTCLRRVRPAFGSKEVGGLRSRPSKYQGVVAGIDGGGRDLHHGAGEDPDTLTETPDDTDYNSRSMRSGGWHHCDPVTPNTLFYHYGGTNEKDKIEANAYLFWHVVEQFEFRIPVSDVGVSFRPDLQHYFQSARSYRSCSVLPGKVCPKIQINPFTIPN
jgi:hypothetical protein